MHSRCKRIFAEIIQSQKRRKSDAPHSAHERSLLGMEPIREHPLMSGQMKGFIFVRIVGFLENRYIIRSAFMEICIFVRIHRIDFQTDDSEIFLCNFYSLTDIFHS